MEALSSGAGGSVFGRLLAEQGVEEVLELGSAFGFLAFHGGSLEEGTDVVAAEAARRAGASLYAVVLPPELQWHVPSHLVVPASSEQLARFLDHVRVAVAVHGYGRAGMWTSILLGGGNRELAGSLAAELGRRLPHYEAVADLARIPPALRGLHPDNPVNRVPGGGVQLELPPRVRGYGPRWASWAGPGLNPDTEGLVRGLTAAARLWA